MGSRKDQVAQLIRQFPTGPRQWWNGEQPGHSVKITRPFSLGVHEVTQGQYRAVMHKSPSHFRGSEDLPVEQVSWLDAVAFCNELSQTRAQETVLSHRGRRGHHRWRQRLPSAHRGGMGIRLARVRQRCGHLAMTPAGWATMRGSSATPGRKRTPLARSCQTPGDFMICWVMSGNGVPTGTTRDTTIRPRASTLPARPRAWSGSPGEGPGNASRGSAGPRSAASSRRGPRINQVGFRVATAAQE